MSEIKGTQTQHAQGDKTAGELERSREGVHNGLKYITSAYKIDFCENIKDKFL